MKKSLGKSGIEVAPLAFGGNVFGWTADEPTSMKLLDHFCDAGFNLIDTADVYSTWTGQAGISETFIGRWLKKSGKRNKVVIATKVGMEMAPGKKGLSEPHIRSSVEDSLRRLQIDHIDLYQAHRDDPETPLEETIGAFARLQKEGKIRAFGASNYQPRRLEEALNFSRQNGLPRFETLQPNYNLFDREEFEAGLQDLCVKEGIGVINYFSLASGFLTGKYRSKEDLAKGRRSSRVEAYLNERGFKILAALDQVAKEEQVSAATVALAWLMAQPGIKAPIASATSIAQLDELLASASLTLSVPALEYLTQASAPNLH